MFVSYDCPNCGANIEASDAVDVAHCQFCGTRIANSLAREREWDARIRLAATRRTEDYVVPPLGCCGVYVLMFTIGSLILSAWGLLRSKQAVNVFAGITLLAAVVTFFLLLWRREKRRRELVDTLRREREAELAGR